MFGHTSHWDLYISQTAVVYPPHPTIQWLVLRPKQFGLISFSLEQGNKLKPSWAREVKSSELLPKFNKFLRQLGWQYSPIQE